MLLYLQKKYLTSDVDQVQFEVDTDHDFLVLACDGVWDAKNITVDAMREAVAKTRNGNKLFCDRCMLLPWSCCSLAG